MVRRTVLLYGESLLLPLVAASLEDSPDLRVSRASSWPEAVELLSECMPDVLIFDLTDTCESQVLPLLFENPHLILIGLDTELNQAVLISGEQAQALTLNSIKEIVQKEGSYGRWPLVARAHLSGAHVHEEEGSDEAEGTQD